MIKIDCKKDVGVFATPRPKRTVRRFCESISVDAIILNNGAVAN